MARYLNPVAANANIAINTASALTVALIGSNTTDVELCTTVDAGVTFGVSGQPPSPPTAANLTASANGGVAVLKTPTSAGSAKGEVQYYFARQVTIPARPYLGLSDQQATDVAEIAADVLADQVSKVIGG